MIYIAACLRDARRTRICVASIRHFYPHVPIRILAGGPLELGLADELEAYWKAPLADVPQADWGWGFIKLEPLFGPPGERFLVLDSDTAFSGPVLEAWASCQAPFLVDDEQQNEANTCRLYYNWREVAAVDSAARSPKFVFNSGQWFGTAGVLARSDFEPFIDWSCIPPKLRHPTLFMPGDQGILNYIINQKVQLSGLIVERDQIMRWPGHGMHSITASSITDRSAPPRIIHWAGFKAPRLAGMPGSDVLRMFEKAYYNRLPGRHWRRRLAALRYSCRYLGLNLSQRLRHLIAATGC